MVHFPMVHPRPSLSEAQAQLQALRDKRARIARLAQRYSGPELPGAAKAQVPWRIWGFSGEKGAEVW